VFYSDFAELRSVQSFALNLNSNGGPADQFGLRLGWNCGSDPYAEFGLAFFCGFEHFAKVSSWTTLAVNPLSSRTADNRKPGRIRPRWPRFVPEPKLIPGGAALSITASGFIDT
jgi:hypothetical protein